MSKKKVRRGPEGKQKAREGAEWKAREGATAQAWQPLREATKSGNVVRVASLLAEGANVDASDPDCGWTALMQVADAGHIEVGKTLIAHGANVNYKHLGGQTALHVACAEGHAAMTKLLLAAGADHEAKTNTDMTPMETARECKRNDWRECLVILEQHSFQSFWDEVARARMQTEQRARSEAERQRTEGKTRQQEQEQEQEQGRSAEKGGRLLEPMQSNVREAGWTSDVVKLDEVEEITRLESEQG